MTRPWRYSALPDRPASRWPGGQRLALWVAVGVESYRPDDGLTEDILPRGAAPDLVNAAWRDYGNRVGAFRLLDGLAGFGIRPAVLVNTNLYDEAPEVLAAARAAGAEFVAHGRSNSDTLAGMGMAEERAYLEAVRDRIAGAEGAAPGGWSSPWLAQNATTVGALAGAGYRYLLDWRLDDQPVRLEGGLMAIPYAAELNDSTTMIGRQADARGFADMIVDEAEELLSGGEQAVVMSVVLHSFISGQPFRTRALMRAFERLREMDIWFCTPSEIHTAVLADPKLAAR